MKFEKVSKEQYLLDASNDALLEFREGGSSTKLYIDTEASQCYEELELPKRATKKSAGYDFYSPCEFTLYPGDTIRISTGIRVLLDEDKFLMIMPRSSHGFKARIQLDNTVAIIDADYAESSNEGHILLKLTNDSHTYDSIKVKKGDRLVQSIIMPYFKVEEDDVTQTRDGGIGSTDHL